MNKGEENIDKLFKDAFSGSQFTVNEAMWKDASALIQANKPARSPFFWVGIAAVAIISIGSIFYFVSDEETAISREFTERSSTRAGLLFTDEIDVNSGSENAEYSFHTPSQEVNKTTTHSNEIASVKSSPSEKPQNNQKQILLSSSSSNLLNVKSTSNLKINQNSEAKISNLGLTYSAINKEQLNEKPYLTNSKVEFISIMSKQSFGYPPSGITENNPRSKEPQKPKFYTPLIVRLSAGYSIGSEINSSGNQPNYSYNSNELNIDFSLEYLITPHWGIQSGLKLNFQTETQKYSNSIIEDNSYFDYSDNSYWNYFDKEITVEDKTWWLGDWWVYGTYTDTIIDSNYISQIDSSLIAKNDTTQINSSAQQKITQLEIPVLVTYNFGKARWNFQVATGASFGVFLNSSGQILNTNDPLSKIETTKRLFNSVQYNYLLSTEISYHLTTQWRVTARPQMKVNLNSLLGNESQMRQTYLFYGANVGLAFSF